MSVLHTENVVKISVWYGSEKEVIYFIQLDCSTVNEATVSRLTSAPTVL